MSLQGLRWLLGLGLMGRRGRQRCTRLPADQPPLPPLERRVIATGGEAADGYDWAIVSAGPPTRPGGTGCRGTIVSLGWLGVGVRDRACAKDQGSRARLPTLLAFFSKRQPGISGLWLFSREPENPEAYQQMMAALEEMGVDTRQARRAPASGAPASGAGAASAASAC